MIAFAIENKDNYQGWGKYELDELQFAYAEISEEDRASSTGQRIKERIAELESGKDHLEDVKQEVAADDPRVDIEQSEPPEPAEPTEQPAEESNNNTPYLIGGIIIAVIIVCLALYLF